MTDNGNTGVGIIIPTKNRADFLIRLLNYHAALNSIHTLYIADSSNEKEASRISEQVNRLKSKLRIDYITCHPDSDSISKIITLFSRVKEKYTCYSGDDDYHVPATLSHCAKFLENNPDYSSAIGRSVSFKLHNNGSHGTISEIHDYPRQSIESDFASERLQTYWGPALTPLINCAVRTEKILAYFKKSFAAKDVVVRGELLPSNLLVIDGKHKVLDRLGFVRQIHDRHFVVPDIYDWLMTDYWHQSYTVFKNETVMALLDKDKIMPEQAEHIFKKAFWNYLNRHLLTAYNSYTGKTKISNKVIPGLRIKITRHFPILKKIYRKLLSSVSNKPQLHYEVMNPGSAFFEDFKAIRDSFSP